MMNTPTPHIAADKKDIAKVVIMPGDPLRSKWYAQHYLDNPKLVNNIRNIQGYTGTWKGIPVTVMASGMGLSSIGIYAYELYNAYDVNVIIRAGTVGGLQTFLNLSDTIVASSAFTDSAFLSHLEGVPEGYIPTADNQLTNMLFHNTEIVLKEKFNGRRRGYVGPILSEELFYSHNSNFFNDLSKRGVLGVEMESAILFTYAMQSQKKAAGIFTVSDNIITGTQMSSEKREKSVNTMMEIILKTIEKNYEYLYEE